jgi:hypothetical protein
MAPILFDAVQSALEEDGYAERVGSNENPGFDFFFLPSERLFGGAKVAEEGVIGRVSSPPSEFSCSYLCSRLEKRFSSLGKRSLSSAVLHTFRDELLSIAIATTFVYGIRFYQRLLLGEVMSFFENEVISLERAVGFATAAIFIDTLGQTILLPWFYNRCKLVALKMRIALTAVIFKKMLRLSPIAAANVGTGHIITLCTSELQRLDTYSGFMGSSIGFIVLSILVVTNIGDTPEGQAGLLMGLLMASISSSLAWPISIFAKLRDKATDARMKLVSEFIPAARGVKMNVMEEQLQQQVNTERGRETMQAKRMLIWKVVNALPPCFVVNAFPPNFVVNALPPCFFWVLRSLVVRLTNPSQLSKGISQFLYVVSSNLLMMGMLLGAQLAEGAGGIPIARFYTAFSICVYIVEMSMYVLSISVLLAH